MRFTTLVFPNGCQVVARSLYVWSFWDDQLTASNIHYHAAIFSKMIRIALLFAFHDDPCSCNDMVRMRNTDTVLKDTVVCGDVPVPVLVFEGEERATMTQ